MRDQRRLEGETVVAKSQIARERPIVTDQNTTTGQNTSTSKFSKIPNHLLVYGIGDLDDSKEYLLFIKREKKEACK